MHKCELKSHICSQQRIVTSTEFVKEVVYPNWYETPHIVKERGHDIRQEQRRFSIGSVICTCDPSRLDGAGVFNVTIPQIGNAPTFLDHEKTVR